MKLFLCLVTVSCLLVLAAGGPATDSSSASSTSPSGLTIVVAPSWLDPNDKSTATTTNTALATQATVADNAAAPESEVDTDTFKDLEEPSQPEQTTMAAPDSKPDLKPADAKSEQKSAPVTEAATPAASTPTPVAATAEDDHMNTATAPQQSHSHPVTKAIWFLLLVTLLPCLCLCGIVMSVCYCMESGIGMLGDSGKSVM